MVGDVNGEIHIIDIENIQFKSHETFVDFACTKVSLSGHLMALVFLGSKRPLVRYFRFCYENFRRARDEEHI